MTDLADTLSAASKERPDPVKGRPGKHDLEGDAGSAGRDPEGDEGDVFEHDAERYEHYAERRQRVEPGKGRRDERGDRAGSREPPKATLLRR